MAHVDKKPHFLSEFFEGLLGHSCRVPGLDLLLQVVLPPNSCLKAGCPIPTTEKSKLLLQAQIVCLVPPVSLFLSPLFPLSPSISLL